MKTIIAEKPVYFISDLHLGLLDSQTEKNREILLVRLLEYIKENGSALYIVGDLFDYWFEYRRVAQKGFYKMLTALTLLKENGVEIHYLIGNHDFMHTSLFQEDVGAILYEDGFHRIINGRKFFIAHGDGLVANDVGYKILKKVLRNKKFQALYSLIHPDLGIWLASGSSKSSRKYTSKKDYGEADSLFEVAKKYIENGADYVIFGHSHQRRFEQYKNGFYINLGSWLEAPCYGVFEAGKFQIIDWQ